MEILKDAQLSLSEPALLHYRTSKGDVEIDFMLEAPDRRVAAVEVKAAKTLRAEDFASLEKARDSLGDRFLRGVVLYTGEDVLPFGDRLMAWPIASLWS